MSLVIVIVLWEACYTASNGQDWVCVSKPIPSLTCFRTAERMQCQFVPYLARRLV